MTDLGGRVALITGAGRMRGIGRATALRLAQDGAAVIVSESRRRPDTFPDHEKAAGWRGAASVVAEIEAAGGKAVAVPCDVTDANDVEAMIALACDAFGAPDAIVNNAGTAGGAGTSPIIDLDDAQWHRTIDSNLNGTYHVAKHAARAMRAAGKPGAIVNLSSLAGRAGMANYGAYCASKFAVIGLTQQLAQELVRIGIRVNCVCPGSVDTDMMDGTFQRTADHSGKIGFPDLKSAVARGIPMRRQGFPHEQAAMIAFLLSDEAAYITGQTINVDGGVRMD
ncbi:SDR family NAD(P)-dependent oxidoreductase [Novosphingobium sp. HII-3]|uniref:SDR family NAD(P)-dependent oxidoreductase n=1 Tax=Novosphingobium sp. HII-3 TaxID=2075565 RepID=UPI0011AF1F7E|nr:SDR family NAD(P)-dependent oxidoreductase [Novosphingobium sp. HII-3]